MLRLEPDLVDYLNETGYIQGKLRYEFKFTRYENRAVSIVRASQPARGTRSPALAQCQRCPFIIRRVCEDQ